MGRGIIKCPSIPETLRCILYHFRFKPIHLSQLLAPLRDKYEKLFMETFSVRENKKFLEKIQVHTAILI